ncbi:MAG: TIGR04076 family protein [Chloroflexota bacterium]
MGGNWIPAFAGMTERGRAGSKPAPTNMEKRMDEIIAEVISQKGRCEAGHKVGDKFIIGQETPPGLCSWAFYVLFPFAQVLEFGGAFPWEKDKDTATVACPDADNPVVFRMRRG